MRAVNAVQRVSRQAAAPGQLLAGAGVSCPALAPVQRTCKGRPLTTMLADSKGSPFHELGLQEVMDGMGRTRVRQHVNPLRSEFQSPMAPPDWSSLYEDATRPLVVDLGCGPGRFLLLLQRKHEEQQQQPVLNYLGVEIRRQLVERANKWAATLGVQRRVQYVFTNATVSLRVLLESYPGPIEACYVQFPDPHWKKKHEKRRVLQPPTVHALRDALRPGGHLFLQSDVQKAAVAMRDAVEQHAGEAFQLAPEHVTQPTFHADEPVPWQASAMGLATDTAAAGSAPMNWHESSNSHADLKQQQQQQQQDPDEENDDVAVEDDVSEGSSDEPEPMFVSQWGKQGGWLLDNPIGVPTEREHYVEQGGGGRVYRVLLVKK